MVTTTVHINEDVKLQLKIKSAELGVSQFDLLNVMSLKESKETLLLKNQY